MKLVKQFFSSQVKSICLLFTIVVGGFWTLSSCTPACDQGNYLGTVEECPVTADAASDGGSTGGSSGGSTGGSTGGSSGGSSGGDTTAPTISSYVPANSSTGIAINSNLTVVFNEGMSSSTVNNTNITLSTGGSNVAATVTLSGNTATLNPDSDLSNSTAYSWTVGTGVQDASGNALASAVTWSFTTASASAAVGSTPFTASMLTPQTRISSGYDANAYILDNGSIVQWGFGSWEHARKTEGIVDNITNATQISIHGGYNNSNKTTTCVITSDNHSVCWGEGSDGQLGDGISTDCGAGVSNTYQKTACAVPVFDDATAQGNLKKVRVGQKSTFWLDNNGKVYSAGICDSGRLGVSCSSNHTTAKTVMTGVKDIDVHSSIACAHKNDNTLHCWGENSGNQITDANSNDVETPLQIGTSVKHFATGSGWVAMVHDNNTVFCTDNWKSSISGMCANKFSPHTNIKDVYATAGVTGLLLDNGTHVSFGYDYGGSMADKTGNSPQNNYTVSYGWIQENGSQTIADNITYISGRGNGHLLAIMDNGSVIGVGANNSGQMGGSNSSLTCYWNGSSSSPCADSSQTNDVWIYLGLSPTQVVP